MFFTKGFIMGEIMEIKKIIEEIHAKSFVESPSLPGHMALTFDGEQLRKVLLKLDVVHNAVNNVRTS